MASRKTKKETSHERIPSTSAGREAQLRNTRETRTSGRRPTTKASCEKSEDLGSLKSSSDHGTRRTVCGTDADKHCPGGMISMAFREAWQGPRKSSFKSSDTSGHKGCRENIVNLGYINLKTLKPWRGPASCRSSSTLRSDKQNPPEEEFCDGTSKHHYGSAESRPQDHSATNVSTKHVPRPSITELKHKKYKSMQTSERSENGTTINSSDRVLVKNKDCAKPLNSSKCSLVAHPGTEGEIDDQNTKHRPKRVQNKFVPFEKSLVRHDEDTTSACGSKTDENNLKAKQAFKPVENKLLKPEQKSASCTGRGSLQKKTMVQCEQEMTSCNDEEDHKSATDKSRVNIVITPEEVADMEEFVKKMINDNIISHSHDPRADIKEFFKKEVQMKACEQKKVAPHFKTLQTEIQKFLESKTPWSWEVFKCGSFYDKTKVSQPNEMDCILVPDLKARLRSDFEGCSTYFCKVEVNNFNGDTKLQELSDGSYVVPLRFRDYIFEILDEYTGNGSNHCEKNLTYRGTPSYGVKYTGVTDMNIDIDFVPAIHIKQWPREARDLKKTLPRDISRHINVDSITKAGFHVVAKHCKAREGELQWESSFSRAEKQFSYHGETESWKPVLRTIKRVLEIAKGVEGRDFSPKSLLISKAAVYSKEKYLHKPLEYKPSFFTYHVRTLMWTLLYGGLTAGFHVWREKSQQDRLMFSLSKLKKMLTGQMVVPHFFLPKYENIIKNTSKQDRKSMYILARATEVIFSRARDEMY